MIIKICFEKVQRDKAQKNGKTEIHTSNFNKAKKDKV